MVETLVPIIMYVKGHCPFCIRAKELLESKGAVYQEIDITGNESLREEMIEKTNRKTVPQIFIGKVHVGGYDDLAALDAEGRLDALLAGQEG